MWRIEAWHSLLDALRDLDTEFLAPDRGIIEDNDIAEGHRMALHLFATAFEMYSAVKPSHPGCSIGCAVVNSYQSFGGWCLLIDDGWVITQMFCIMVPT